MNKVILKLGKLFLNMKGVGEMHNGFTEEINKIELSSNDDKRMQSIDSIEKYAYGTRKDLVSEKGEIKDNNVIERYKND